MESYAHFNVMSFPYNKLQDLELVKRRRGNQGAKTHKDYYNCICAFDIETSAIPQIRQSLMYVWQFAITEKCVVMGRTWDEFKYFLSQLTANLPDDTSNLIIFVHNLSYEFQFLSGIFPFQKSDVFAVNSRKVLKASLGQLEFRCSYLLSNMSLDLFTKKYNAKHKKQSGEDFDYSKTRYPWTKLTPLEKRYAEYDVIGLVEAVSSLMEMFGDDLRTLPLTSTGFVRRDVKRAMHDCRLMVLSQNPDLETYRLLYEAFRGGDTHANRYYSGILITEDMGGVDSHDRKSSYPEVICNCEFPMSEFYNFNGKIEDVENLIYKLHKAVLFKIRLTNVRLKYRYWGLPYIPRAKCSTLTRGIFDNGRVLSADSLTIALTDVDYDILKREYLWDDIEVLDCKFARYSKLPRQLIDVVIQYYGNKTSLKGVEGAETLYMKSKNLLNAIYGMMVTNLCKRDYNYIYNDDFPLGGFVLDEETPLQSILDKANKKAFVTYAWGVWVTAHARHRLHKPLWGLDGRLDNPLAENFVYCDTDSIKNIAVTGVDEIWEKYNAEMVADSTLSGAYATDPKGRVHYMGVFDYEAHYTMFKTLGAKKYAIVENSRLELTVAGLNKKLGASELLSFVHKFGPYCEKDYYIALDKYFNYAGECERPTIFHAAAALKPVYNDCEPFVITVDNKNIEITKNIFLEENTYTLGITQEYEEILSMSREEWRQLSCIKLV